MVQSKPHFSSSSNSLCRVSVSHEEFIMMGNDDVNGNGVESFNAN